MSTARQSSPERQTRVLQFSIVITLAYIVLLVAAGIKANSLALLSEAGHNVSDFLALLLSLVAVYMQRRPPSNTKTYGYSRAGVIAAFINSGALVLLAFYIFYQAFMRLNAPAHIHPGLMIGVAVAGVLMNGSIALMLFASSHDLNIRSSFLHELGDTLSTAAVIAGGWAIMITGQSWIDSALSFGIGALILWSSLGIIRDTLNILLEGIPKGMELNQIEAEVRRVQGVNDIHDLHVWSIGANTHALSCHVAIADIPPSESEIILRQVQDMLRERFHIQHTTIQFEHAACDIAHGCVIPISPHEHHPDIH